MLRTPLTCAALCLLAVGCASTPSAPPPATAAASAPAKVNCYGPPSASRLPHSGCDQGQTYSQTDVQSTGQPTAAAALQTLDPLVHH
jgi:hypothetical protein